MVAHPATVARRRLGATRQSNPAAAQRATPVKPNGSRVEIETANYMRSPGVQSVYASVVRRVRRWRRDK